MIIVVMRDVKPTILYLPVQTDVLAAGDGLRFHVLLTERITA